MQIAALNEEWLVNILDRVFFLADCGGYCFNADGPSVKFFDDSAKDRAIHVIESLFVDLEHLECVLGYLLIDKPLRPYLREVAHAAQQPVSDSWRSARTGGIKRSRTVGVLQRECDRSDRCNQHYRLFRFNRFYPDL